MIRSEATNGGTGGIATLLRRLRGPVILLLVLSPIGAQAQSKGREKSCGKVVFSSPQHASGAEAEQFSATGILDLEIAVLIKSGGRGSDLGGEQTAELRVIAPSGNLYQVLTVPFTTDRGMEGRERRVEGYPRPLRVQEARAVNHRGQSYQRVLFRLPVGGTAITANGLYGRWTVEAAVQVDCVVVGAFELTQ